MSQPLQIGSEGLSSTAAEIVAKMERGELDRLTAIAALQALLDSPKQPTRPVSSTRMSLAEMIADAGITDVNKHITAVNFPNDAFGTLDATHLTLYAPGWSKTSIDVEGEAKAQGKRLEGIIQGLAYIKANPDALKSGPIVFLKTTWKPSDAFIGTLVIYAKLEGGVMKLCLEIDNPGVTWSSRDRFIASNIN